VRDRDIGAKRDDAIEPRVIIIFRLAELKYLTLQMNPERPGKNHPRLPAFCNDCGPLMQT
jgi:hypothetical protein